jgi:ribosomal-protein-alanine N-acetyltransferase
MKADDWQSLFAIESDPEVVRYQAFEPFSAERARDYLRDAERDRLLRPRQCFDLAVLVGEAMIGRVGMRLVGDREASIWFSFRRDQWGTGYASEAARALVDYAFHHLGVHRIFGDCDPHNLGSIRVMEKLGMRREAHHVENAFIKNQWCDSLIYAILEREWR